MSRLGYKLDRNIMIILLGIIAMSVTCDEGIFIALKFLTGAYCFLTVWEALSELGITKYVFDKLEELRKHESDKH